MSENSRIDRAMFCFAISATGVAIMLAISVGISILERLGWCCQ